MRTRLWAGCALIAATACAVAWAGSTFRPGGTAVQEDKDQKPDPAEEPILKNADAFVQAFNKGDAKTLAAFWTEKGEHTDLAGEKSVGRAAIEKDFKVYFEAHPNVQLRIEVEGIKFLSPDVAVEDGITAVLTPDGPPLEARYTNIHVRQDGKWLLESVKVSPYVAPSNAANLGLLEPLIGTWEDENEHGSTTIEFEWTENRNFILVHYATTRKGALLTGGTAWVGWDPTEKTVRSWLFEGNGGFGSGTWTKQGDKLTSRSTGVMPDGRKIAMSNTITKLDANTIQWEITARTLDGKQLPDAAPAKMKRVIEK